VATNGVVEMLENDFVVARKCAECKSTLDPDDNWACVKGLIPIFGGIGEVFVHQHIHIGCAQGDLKWLALRAICIPRAGDN
jgi:hypothetical protein